NWKRFARSKLTVNPSRQTVEDKIAAQTGPADGDSQPDAPPRPTEYTPGHVRFRDADERLRLRLGKAFPKIANAHAGVDQHRHGRDFEQRKCEGEEFQPR